MLEVIKKLLAGGQAPARSTPGSGASAPGDQAARDRDAERLRVAACVLLLELAYADGHFSADERQRIEQSLVTHFDLSAADARDLMQRADERRRESVELHQFTSRLTSAYDEGQRLLLAEIMWRIVEADGQLSEHEDYLMRKLGRLLDLKPGYLSEARKRVLSPPTP